VTEVTAPRVDWVLGTGRCGSTLVHEVLCRHPDIAFLSNLEDRSAALGPTGRLNRVVYDRLPEALTRKGRVRFAPSEGYRALEREVSPTIVDPMRDLTAADATPWLVDRLRGFFARRADGQGRRFVHKLTGWPRAGLLAVAFPEARFVHVVRDGRAVANSWLQMEWWRGHRGPSAWHFGPLPPDLEEEWLAHDRSFVVLAGLAWRLLMDAYDAAAAAVGADRWLEVRYEDVVAEPRRELGRVLAFLGVDDDARFDQRVGGSSFRTGRTQAFRRDLTHEQVAALDAVLGAHLRARGYAV